MADFIRDCIQFQAIYFGRYPNIGGQRDASAER